MIQFDLPKDQSSIIKVIGMGGGGSNAVNFMYEEGIEGVDFIVCNTDSQALADSPIPNKIHLGPQLTQGLGAGADPDIGRKATEESVEEIKKILEVNTKMAFITAGMGGGTGTGGAPIVAKICQDLGILTVGIVTSPFSYEGKRRMNQAREGVTNLKEHVDTLLVISNDKLRIQFGNLPFKVAFAKADNILATATKCITGIINTHGVVNVDFADVSTAMRKGGVAILGSGKAEGPDRAQEAIDKALSSPLLNDSEIRGAQWILLNITSSEEHEHTIDEMDIIQAHLQQMAGEDCDVILGMGHDNTLEQKIGVTIIATGFHQRPIEEELYLKNPMDKKEQGEKIKMELGKEGEEKKIYGQDQLPLDFMEDSDVRSEEERMENEEEENPFAQDADDPFDVEEEPSIVFELDQEEESSYEQESYQEEAEEPEEEEITPRKGRIYMEIPAKRSENDIDMEKVFDEKPKREEHPQPMPKDEHEEKPFSVEQEEKKEKKKNLRLVFKETKGKRFHLEDDPKTYKRPEDNPNIARTVYPYPNYEKDMESKSSSSGHSYKKDRKDAEEKVEENRAQLQQRITERSQRLRRMNMGSGKMDSPDDLENVPAYIRKNVELKPDQELASETDFSGYHIRKTEDGKRTEISTINTFLDGKKPD